MENTLLSILALLAFVYCCDFPVLFGMDFLIHQKDSIWFSIGCSIDAAYIFYIIQVLLPQKIKERKAYYAMKDRIDRFISELYHLYVFCREICIFDKEKGTISIPSHYVLKIEGDEINPWLEKFVPENFISGINKTKKRISEDKNYLYLSKKMLKLIQPLLDNDFPDHFWKSQKYSDMCNTDLMKSYEEFIQHLQYAQRKMKSKESYHLKTYTDQSVIAQFEMKLSHANPNFLKEEQNYIPYMCISLKKENEDIVPINVGKDKVQSG